MALSRRLSSIDIQKQGGLGWAYSITTKDFDVSLGAVFFNESYDEAVDGTLRSNFRGYRMRLELNWDSVISGTFSGTGDLRSFLNNLTDLTGSSADDYVSISFDGSNYHQFIPEDVNQITAYTNQVGRTGAQMIFVGRTITTSIPEDLEAI